MGGSVNEQIAQLTATISSDPFTVGHSDNPSASLTSVLFNGDNFIPWSRQIRLGLGTKMKLGFIDGSIVAPEDEKTIAYQKWLRCDRLVACWLLSSMTPEIAISFVYTTNAFDLWQEIQERYKQNNASLLYQVKMESMRIMQGNLSVTAYYNKLKKCWDDIACMNGIPACVCGNLVKCSCKILARMHELEAQDRLLHFLINLNSDFDATKNQILSSVPVPTLSVAYQIVLQVEKQKQMSNPMVTGLQLKLTDGELLSDGEQYRRLVGRLLYLSLTRPDISYSVQHLSQFVSQPRMPHLQAALHVLRYLKGTARTGLFYPLQETNKVIGFSDADWASCLTTRRSLTGYCVFFGSCLISWKTKKQTTVSRSSAESEYRSMAAATSELLWTSYLLKDLHVSVPLPITLYVDSQAAQQIAANPCFHERTKHLEIDLHFTREKVQSGFLKTSYIPTKLQLADILTKALNKQSHSFLSVKLGLVMVPSLREDNESLASVK